MNRAKAEAVVDAIIDAVVAHINVEVTRSTLPSYYLESTIRTAKESRQKAIDSLCLRPKEDDETC